MILNHSAQINNFSIYQQQTYGEGIQTYHSHKGKKISGRKPNQGSKGTSIVTTLYFFKQKR